MLTEQTARVATSQKTKYVIRWYLRLVPETSHFAMTGLPDVSTNIFEKYLDLRLESRKWLYRLHGTVSHIGQVIRDDLICVLGPWLLIFGSRITYLWPLLGVRVVFLHWWCFWMEFFLRLILHLVNLPWTKNTDAQEEEMQEENQAEKLKTEKALTLPVPALKSQGTK